MTILVTPVVAASQVESVYRQDGDRLWRALYAYAGNTEVASDAVAEAFAQALRRGSAIKDVRAWVCDADGLRELLRSTPTREDNSN